MPLKKSLCCVAATPCLAWMMLVSTPLTEVSVTLPHQTRMRKLYKGIKSYKCRQD